jgi:nitrate reductase gamma subunit
MHQETSGLLATAEVIHWISLAVMGLVYALRIRWLLGFKLGKDMSAPGNPALSNKKKGARYSLMNIFMPWAMESTRKGFGFYLTFVIFHLGVVVGITLAFVSTVARPFLENRAVFWVFEVFLIGAFLIGIYRIFRRLLRPVMRLISTPDDYFSLFMLTGWFALGAVTEAYIYGVSAFANELQLVAYLLLTSFFLLYVPFSKISHYLYYPFSRIYIGRALGHRGSYPYSRG